MNKLIKYEVHSFYDDDDMWYEEKIKEILDKPIIIQETGKIWVSRNLAIKMGKNNSLIEFVHTSLHRFLRGDWGNTEKNDAALNELTLKGITENRIYAEYDFNEETKICIVTEWDRTSTTIMLANEY